MFSFLTNLVDRAVQKVSPSIQDRSAIEQGVLIYHENGSMTLNLENQEVQRKIVEQLEELSQINIEELASSDEHSQRHDGVTA